MLHVGQQKKKEELRTQHPQANDLESKFFQYVQALQSKGYFTGVSEGSAGTKTGTPDVNATVSEIIQARSSTNASITSRV